MKSLNFKTIAHFPVLIRLVIFLLVLLVIWLPIAIPLSYFFRHDQNLATILTMGCLFGEFLLLLPYWGKWVHEQPQIFRHYGFVKTRTNGIEFVHGLSLGLLFTLSLFILEGILGWQTFQAPSQPLMKIILEGFLSALGIGLAEELFFRGWLLDEWQRDYSPTVALWVNGFLFSFAHFIKPWELIVQTGVRFPWLILFAALLIWSKRSHSGRLGYPIGLHGGLVWGYYILNVGQLVQDSQQVPPWITGIDGDPTTGLMGLLFLGILAWWIKRKSDEFPLSNL